MNYSMVGRLVFPIEFIFTHGRYKVILTHDLMSFSMSYVVLSVKTFFHKYELKSRLIMNLIGIMRSTE